MACFRGFMPCVVLCFVVIELILKYNSNEGTGDIMSLGIGAFANKVFEDNDVVSFKYGVYNMNEQELQNQSHISDGSITILKKTFVEPEIHNKIKRINGRKKKISIRVTKEVDISGLLRNKSIAIENSRFCWKTIEDESRADIMALRLVSKIFMQYQTDSVIPELISFDM
jgi:hypothetical protein